VENFLKISIITKTVKIRDPHLWGVF